MNRRELRARSWVHWAALCAALVAILAVWGLWPAEPPWLIITSLCLAFLALLVVESRYRREHPPPVVEAASVEEFLAAVDRRFGTGGGVSGAAVPHTALWNGEVLPPFLPPVMATAPYPGHDHEGPGPCPACLAVLGPLARLAGLQGEAGERLAAPDLAAYAGRLMADTDTQAREYLAGLAADMDAAREDLGAALAGGAPCAAEFGQHLCSRRVPHDAHRCQCGTVWGMT